MRDRGEISIEEAILDEYEGYANRLGGDLNERFISGNNR